MTKQAALSGPGKTMEQFHCRSCGELLETVLIDLGVSQLANSYVSPDNLALPEPVYPLKVRICDICHLAQLPAFETPANIFLDYAYYSSYSASWLKHAEKFVDGAVKRFGLGPGQRVVEIASNDGYLLQYFARTKVQVLGIEPARGPAAEAKKKGVPTITEFFGRATAERLRSQGLAADMIIANNVLAHVPDINDFISGLEILLKTKGTVTVEFPSLLKLIENNQFDTIYHEHFSYLCLTSALFAFRRHGLDVYDVEELETHGGSLRLYVCHKGAFEANARVAHLLEEERRLGLGNKDYYFAFAERAHQVRREMLQHLQKLRAEGKSVAGYGAPAKGNTLLNYCAIGPELVEYTVDANPHKQGMFLPGNRIPVFAPSKIHETRPAVIVILPWNLREELLEQLQPCRAWGAKFLVPIPRPEILN